MKNKKNILAIVSLIAGIVCLCYYLATKNTMIVKSRPFFNPLILADYSIVLINAIAMILYGLCGTASTSRAAKIILSAVALCTSVASCILFSNLPILYCIAVVSLISLLVQVIDNSPEKKLFFVYYKGDILMSFDTQRPSYKLVYYRVHHKKIEIKDKEPSKKAKKPSRKKKYTGYAISPKSKNYRKNARKKNKKR